MRTGVLGAQRPEPHDRNPVRQTLTYSGTGIAPHATTQRFSYTVPSGKKAIVLAAQANLQRATAATTAAITRASVQLQNTLVVDARISMSSASRLAVVDVPDADVPTKAPQGVLVAPWVPLGQVTVHYYTRAVRKEWNDLIRRRYGGAHAEWDAAKVVAPLPP